MRAQQSFRVPAEKITVIPNGCVLPTLSPEIRRQTRRRFNLAPDDMVLVFVGRGEDPVKGASTLVSALSVLVPNYPRLRLLAVPGTGFPDSPWIRPSGPVPYDEISACYAAADIFVNVSLNEGLPLTLLEAMAASLPVIAAPVGGIPEIITNNHNGILLQPDRRDLALKITSLLNEENLREKLGRNAYRHAQQFSWGQLAQETLQLYESLLR